MKVVCKGHKTCISKECVHKILHNHGDFCVNTKISDCYCCEDNQYIRKLKLEKINESR